MLFSKVDELVESDEEIQKSVHPSRLDSKYAKSFLTSIGLFVGVTGILIGNELFQLGMPTTIILASYLIPLFVYARGDLHRKFVMYHFTDREIIEEYGIVNKDLNSIPYERIQDVVLDEELEERMFDVGDIHIRTAGTDNSEQVLNGLKDPESYKVEISKRATGGGRDSGGKDEMNFSQDSGNGNQNSDQDPGFSGGNNQNSGTAGVESDVLDDELNRVERQIQQLNQKSNSQGLSESERQRWYKLEGQRELLQRLEEQSSDQGSSDLDF